MFGHLLAPLTIRGHSFRNRIFSSGHQTLLARGGEVGDAMIAYHEARARGAAGLIVTEAIAVHESAYFNEVVPTGYLPIEFCKPRVNQRDDDSGGSFDKRLRFLNEIQDLIRVRVGEAAVVGLRISKVNTRRR